MSLDSSFIVSMNMDITNTLSKSFQTNQIFSVIRSLSKLSNSSTPTIDGTEGVYNEDINIQSVRDKLELENAELRRTVMMLKHEVDETSTYLKRCAKQRELSEEKRRLTSIDLINSKGTILSLRESNRQQQRSIELYERAIFYREDVLARQYERILSEQERNHRLLHQNLISSMKIRLLGHQLHDLYNIASEKDRTILEFRGALETCMSQRVDPRKVNELRYEVLSLTSQRNNLDKMVGNLFIIVEI